MHLVFLLDTFTCNVQHSWIILNAEKFLYFKFFLAYLPVYHTLLNKANLGRFDLVSFQDQGLCC